MALGNTTNLPSVQRFKFEDYPGAPQWFAQFLMTLNLFVTAIYNIVNDGITYANLGVIQPVSFVYTPGTTPAGFNFANPLIQVPQNVVIGNIYIGTQLQNHPTVVTQLYWHYSQGSIFVDSILGLTTGVNYTVTVQVS